MTEAKHTPGPWYVVVGKSRMVCAPQTTNKPIAVCNFDNGQAEKANASLIAAAPDLLEALEKMVGEYPYNPPCKNWEDKAEAHTTARAAIAKAKGYSK